MVGDGEWWEMVSGGKWWEMVGDGGRSRSSIPVHKNPQILYPWRQKS